MPRVPEPERLARIPFDPPEPPPEFRRHVMKCIQEADDFVREQYGMRHHRIAARGVPHRGVRRKRQGCCVGCQCPLDERTAGCLNCKARHDMRLHNRLDRICRMIERAFP